MEAVQVGLRIWAEHGGATPSCVNINSFTAFMPLYSCSMSFLRNSVGILRNFSEPRHFGVGFRAFLIGLFAQTTQFLFDHLIQLPHALAFELLPRSKER